VDLEGELISALDELKKAKEKNKQLKEQLFHVEEGMYNSKMRSLFIKDRKLKKPLKEKTS